MFKKLLLIFFITILAESITAQKLAGFLNGKISRKSGRGYGADNFEIHIYQSGKEIWGYSFAYTDTSRFVLYKFKGTLSKKEKQIIIQEFGFAFVLIPEQFYPCEKKLELKYSKINNTKYLTGKCSGVIIDTTCYADEELVVAVQKVNISFFKDDMGIVEKMIIFLPTRKNTAM